MGKNEQDRSTDIQSGLAELRTRRRKWVDANRENGFEEGINNLLTQLYPYDAHFIYELLQNAEDPRASVVRFTLNKDSIEFEHDGHRLFSFKDVESITSIGHSTKKNDPTAIGKFGVGFKAVFSYTNTPEIHSGDFHFRISDLVVPETSGVPKIDIGNQTLTRFRFPFDNPSKPADKAVDEIEKGMRNLGHNTLLFLSHIEKIEYLLPDGSLGYLERLEMEGGRVEIRAIQPDGPRDTTNWLRFSKDVYVTDDEGNQKDCRVAIAYRLAVIEDSILEEWKIVPNDRGQVSIYFPAEKEISNLRFDIHAPFASTVARDSVRDTSANRELLEHIGDLIVESLHAIKDAGMLTIDFLAVLPNPGDNLPAFYEPIREKIVSAFKTRDLTPTRSGAFAPSDGLYRGAARIQEVIDDDDLAQVTGYDAPLWAKNPPQEKQRESRFLDSLELDAWDWSDLSEFMQPHSSAWNSEQIEENERRKELIEKWLRRKSDPWMLRFYAILGECATIRGEQVRFGGVRLVRIEEKSADNHVVPRQAFFPSETSLGAIPTDVLFVKPEVYLSGRSEGNKRSARAFLEFAGVKTYDAQAGIERLLALYRAGQMFPLKKHVRHIRQFISHWNDARNSVSIFKGVRIFSKQEEGEPEKYFDATELYLDIPYESTGLSDLFSDLSLKLEKRKYALSNLYVNVEKVDEFATALGAMHRMEICTGEATQMQKSVFQKIGRKTSSTIDVDYFLNGLGWYQAGSSNYIGSINLVVKNFALSKVIWRTMCLANAKVLTAHYLPNDKHVAFEKKGPSLLAIALCTYAWIPDREGDFHIPADLSREALHEDFEFNDKNGWLTAIGFGESVKKRSEEELVRDRDAQRLGFASSLEAEEFANLRKEGVTPAEIRTFIAQRKKLELPADPVKDPERRRKNVLDNAEDAPSKESVKRERAIQKDISEVTAKAKAYLRAKYRNQEQQLICQCCHLEMPFKLPSGEHYFEAIQCLEDKGERHFQNRLALCPTCAAMYKHARQTDDAELRSRIESHEADEFAPSIDLSIRLAGRDQCLRFVGTHWFDLKTIVSSIGT